MFFQRETDIGGDALDITIEPDELAILEEFCSKKAGGMKPERYLVALIDPMNKELNETRSGETDEHQN